MQLPGFDINVPGEDVVQHHVLHKVIAVVLFVVILLNGGQGDGQKLGILGSAFVGPFHKHGVVRFDVGAKGLIGIAVPDKGVVGITQIQGDELIGQPHFGQVTARNDGSRLIHNADDPIDDIPHLVNDSLK